MKSRNTISWVAIFLFFLSFPVLTAAEEYYVSLGGEDSDLGSFENPWKTISKAAETLQAGDTVYVRAGTYLERVKPQNSGNAVDGYITYSNYQDEVVILRDTGLPSGSEDEVMFWVDGLSYIKVIGFHVGEHKGNGIRVDGEGDHIEIRYCIVSNQVYSPNSPLGWLHALLISGWLEDNGPLKNVIVDNCEIYNNDTCDPYGGCNEAFTIIGDVSDFQITNNYIHDNQYIGNDYIGQPFYEGLACGIPTDGLIKGNVLVNNGCGAGISWASGIYSDGSGYGTPDEIICEENICVGNNFAGIELGDEHKEEVSGGWTVRKNICRDNDYYGIILTSFGTEIKNTKVYNNVFYKNKINEISINSNYVSLAEFRNNIVYDPGPYSFIYWEGPADSTITSDYNCWWPAGKEFQWGGSYYTGLDSFKSGTGQDLNSIEENPLFIDKDNYDFHIQENSPCINKGVDVGLPFAGDAPDIGAYEYGDVIECTDGQERPCYDGPSGTAGVGICKSGSQLCQSGVWSACTDQVRPQTEICDGLEDEDCDGIVDNGCTCEDDQERECYQGPNGTLGVGTCQAGTQVCLDGSWPESCSGQVVPVTEICEDLKDNDCDGQIDEDCEEGSEKIFGGCTGSSACFSDTTKTLFWIFITIILIGFCKKRQIDTKNLPRNSP